MASTRPLLKRTYGQFFTSNDMKAELSEHPFAYDDVLKHIVQAQTDINNNIINIGLTQWKVFPGKAYVQYRDPHLAEICHTGFKFHISLGIDDLKASLPGLYNIFKAYGIPDFKLMHSDFLLKHPASLKQITIYQSTAKHMTVENWRNFLQAIEQELHHRKCVPGIIPPANKLIEGSRFISYRHDQHPMTGKYITDNDAAQYAALHPELEAHNLCGTPDPFKDIKLAMLEMPRLT